VAIPSVKASPITYRESFLATANFFKSDMAGTGHFSDYAAGTNEMSEYYAWAGLVLLRAYQLTGDTSYLNEALAVANFLQTKINELAPTLQANGLTTGAVKWIYPGWTSTIAATGQAKCIIFLTELYKETGTAQYLNMAKGMADFLVREMRYRSQSAVDAGTDVDGKFTELSTNNGDLVGGYAIDLKPDGSDVQDYEISTYINGDVLWALKLVDQQVGGYSTYITALADQLSLMIATLPSWGWGVNLGDKTDPGDDVYTVYSPPLGNKYAVRAVIAAVGLRMVGRTTQANNLLIWAISQQSGGKIYSCNYIRANAMATIAMLDADRPEAIYVLNWIRNQQLTGGKFPKQEGGSWTGHTDDYISTAYAGLALYEGQKMFVDSKTETTPSGDYTVNAKTEADTEVDKKGDGTPTVTIAKYTSNPGGTPTFSALGKYIDVSINDATGVTEIVIRIYYTDADIAGFDESSLKAYWWTGSAWVLCDPQTLHTGAVDGYSGYIQIGPILAAGTTPTLSQLVGTPFGLGGERVPVGGYLMPVDRLAILAPYLALLGLTGALSIAIALKRRLKA
jgi:hypothetical protein